MSAAEELTLWSELARDHGARRTLVDPISRQWQDEALDAIQVIADTGMHFTADYVRARVGDPPTPACMGAVFRRAAQLRLIEMVGIERARRIQRHAGLLTVWRGVK